MINPIILMQAERMALKKANRQIRKQESLVKAVIHIGTLRAPSTFFLYILIDRKRYFPDYDLNELIEHITGLSIPLFVIIESADIVDRNNGLDRQFLNYALARGFVVYQANDLHLEKPVSTIISEPNGDQLWKCWQRQSRLYFKSFAYYVERGDYEMALYNLHQSMEMSLLGSLQVRTGFRTTTPNFQRLISMTLLFTDQVTLFFEQLKTDHPDLHHLLWNVCPEESRRELVIWIKRTKLTPIGLSKKAPFAS